MYPMLERISPRTRKLELFARMHNTHAGYYYFLPSFLLDTKMDFLFLDSIYSSLKFKSFFRWISLGNQLNGVRLVDEGLRARFKAAYPDVEIQPPDPPTKADVEICPVIPRITESSPGRVSENYESTISNDLN
jgi:mRNA (2'-O-methyladenosine-N6-)-methyltransferase